MAWGSICSRLSFLYWPTKLEDIILIPIKEKITVIHEVKRFAHPVKRFAHPEPPDLQNLEVSLVHLLLLHKLCKTGQIKVCCLSCEPLRGIYILQREFEDDPAHKGQEQDG